jgi:RNA polymerase sigma-70 factor, ECF subfamily
VKGESFSDEELMVEVAAGNRDAFEQLAKRHLRKSVGLARRIVSNGDDAEEIVQDAFLQIWAHADRWRANEARFSTWLYRIVLNRCFDYRRRRTFSPIEDAADVPTALPDALTAVGDKELRMHVETAIQGLSERQRAALSLVYFEEMSCGEAARVLELSESATESLLVRARRALRQRLHPVVVRHSEEGKR